MTCEKVAINGPNLKKLAHKKSNWRKWWRKKKNPSTNLAKSVKRSLINCKVCFRVSESVPFIRF